MKNHGTYTDEEERNLIEFIKKMITECEASGKTPAFGSNNFWQRAIDEGYCKKDRTAQSVRCWYYQKATRGDFLPAVHFQRAKIQARQMKMKRVKNAPSEDNSTDFPEPVSMVSIESMDFLRSSSKNAESKKDYRRPWTEEEDRKLYDFVTSMGLKNMNPLFAGPKLWKMAINQGVFQNRTIGALRSRVHYHWPQIVARYSGLPDSNYADSDPSYFDSSDPGFNITSSGLVEYIYGRPTTSTSNDLNLFDTSDDIVKDEDPDDDDIILEEDCNLPVTGISEVSITSVSSSMALVPAFEAAMSATTSRSGSEVAIPTSKGHELRKESIKISQSDMFSMIQEKIHELQYAGKMLIAEPLERISDVVFMTLKRATETNQPAEVLVRKEAEYLLKTDRQKEVVDFVVIQPHVLDLIDEVHKRCCSF